MRFAVMEAGTLTNKLSLTPTNLGPTTTDTLALGDTTQFWSDLFLATGAVVNWNNGNVTLTHSAGALAFAGATITADNSIKSSHATAGIGYGTGAGGTVTQATDKSTAVELNKTCGAITMNGAALNTNTTVAFTLTNSAIAATDAIVVNPSSAGTAGSYLVWATTIAGGSCVIQVRNISGGSLSEAIVLTFSVIKAVTA